MHELVNGFGSRCAVRLAMAGVTAALLAGCSSDVTRFSGDPFGNPFNTASGSTDQSPVASIQQPGGQAYAAAQASRRRSSRDRSPRPRVARYSAPATPNPPLIAQNSAAAHPRESRRGSTAGWSAEGGTPIVVAQGETAGILATAMACRPMPCCATNGFRSAAEIQPGTRLVIPVYNAAAASAHPQRLSQAAPQAGAKEKILPTRTIPGQQVANAMRRRRRRPCISSRVRSRRSAAAGQDRRGQAAHKPRQERDKSPTRSRRADANPKRPGRRSAQARQCRYDDDRQPAAGGKSRRRRPAPADTANPPEFRWPAHGRIIQGFNAGGNDGINIAVPEGTAVKAAEDGVVAYAGDELKGYGKLVLIRHPNGFVSAYANNQDITVKRGDTVKRGQVIAKSGQTGNVASPQLHFELRKGSTPVDPTQYLAGL